MAESDAWTRGRKRHSLKSVAARCRTSVVTGPAALRLHGIKTYRWVTIVDLALRGTARAFDTTTPSAGRTYRSGILRPEDITTVDGIAVVTGIRALFDTYRYHPRTDALVAIESARHLHKLSAENLLDRARQLPRAKGLRGFRELIGYSAGTSQSPLETLGRDGILRAIASGTLTGVTNLEFQAERTILTARGEPRRALVDATINAFLGIEFDGKVKLSGIYGDPHRVIEEERMREKQLQNLGMVICRFGWGEVENGSYIAVLQNLLRRYPGTRPA
ncbi:hypothetical protein [Corynebacterium sanguinis]|uniref:hypothetical protein n=1 Tax=Corynebacterium sanguinis TaxID=2594913 RepID=UPI00223C2AC7|nr:hypothetical protein [Corynebacterium sanguinis]MCT2159331.1 hypothetical protein [Corynebacterium sanguinis]